MRPGSRWPIALRAAASTAIVLVACWAAGDISAGLIATLGTFTARFGSGRPYLNRGIQLAVVAVALAGAVTLGSWAAPHPVYGVLAVSVVAVTAVWLCGALSVGPPGAYIFVVACAAGVGVSSAHRPALQVGLLVLAGGACAWVLQMAGALGGVRRPERTAVTAAAAAVGDFIEARGTDRETAARNRAAAALHQSWSVLVNYQPLPVRPGSTLYRLRAANHALHVLFTDAMTGPGGSAQDAHRIGALEADAVASHDDNRVPLGRPAVADQLRRAVRPGAHIRDVMLRVAVGIPVAGALAAALGLTHPYWAMAAAVLVLHQGSDRTHTLRRGGERLVGTWIGLGLAGVILLLHPQGLWLALILTLLQLTIELLVTRNYALASVFITATALTISSASHPVDVGEVLLARGADTLIGCAVGVAVYLVAVRFQETTRLPTAIAAVLDAVADTCEQVAADHSMTLAARTARRELQVATLAMREAEEAAQSGSAAQRATAQRLATTTMAAEHIAYRTLSACWAMEHDAATSPFGAGAVEYPRGLRALADAVRRGTAPPSVDAAVPFLRADLTELRESLG